MQRVSFPMVALLLLIAGIAGVLSCAPTSRGTEFAGRDFHGQLYLPAAPPPWPAVVCVYSMYQAPATTGMTAAALADRGVLVLDLDLSEAGHRFEAYAAEVMAAVDYVSRRSDVRADRVTLLGHSMGADLAASVAVSDPRVRRLAAVGFPAAVPPPPLDVLLAVGMFDELHPVAEMRSALQRGGRDPDGLLVLPLANHVLEIYDDGLLDRVAEASSSRSLRLCLLACGVAFFGGTALTTWILTRLARPVHLLSTAAVLAVALAWWHARGVTSFATMLCLTSSTIVANVVPRGRRLEDFLGSAARYAGALSVSFGVAYLAGSCAGLRPQGLLFFVYVIPASTSVALMKSNAQPGLVGLLAALALVEAFAPGRIGRALLDLGGRLVNALRGLDLRPRGKVSPGAVLALVILLPMAVVAWRNTLSAGYRLDASELLGLAALLLRVVVLPLFVFTILSRTRWLR